MSRPEPIRYADPLHPAHPLREITLWRPTWCNCLIWARHQQRAHGGYLMQRRSVVRWRWRRAGRDRLAFWPHALWSPDGETCFEYTTDKPAWLPWYRLPAMLLFRGRVQRVTRQWP